MRTIIISLTRRIAALDYRLSSSVKDTGRIAAIKAGTITVKQALIADMGRYDR